MNNYYKHIGKILISSEEIDKRISELADKINAEYKDSTSLVIIGILKGSFVFLGDLIKKINVPVTVDFIKVSSYEGTSSTGKIKLNAPVSGDIKGKDVILVEDIVDTGLTVSYLNDYLKKKQVHSVKVCTLLSKPGSRKVHVNVDYEGFKIGNEFIVGYGLDYNGMYRNLPYIALYNQKIDDK